MAAVYKSVEISFYFIHFLVSYEKPATSFDQGVACLVRADPAMVKESWMRAHAVDQRDAGFVYGLNEELVSNVVSLAPANDGDLLPVSRGLLMFRKNHDLPI